MPSSRLFPAPQRLPELLYLGIGLLVVVEEQFSLSVIRFEHSLRPEALFSFFAALQVCLVIEFVRARWLESRPRSALLAGGCAVFVSWVLFFLKPALGLALIPANLPVALSLFTSGMSTRRKCLLVAAPGLALLVLLLMPEWRLRRSDSEALAFLPETLFTIHADLIHRQMAEDVADGAAVPYPREWLAKCAAVWNESWCAAPHPPQTRIPRSGSIRTT